MTRLVTSPPVLSLLLMYGLCSAHGCKRTTSIQEPQGNSTTTSPSPLLSPLPTATPSPASTSEEIAPVVRQRAIRLGKISRDRLSQALDKGPGSFFRQYDLSPVFRSGSFYGWRVDNVSHSEQQLLQYDVAIGDYLVSINDLPIATPKQFHTMWESLRQAPSITVTISRGSSIFSIQVTITDSH